MSVRSVNRGPFAGLAPVFGIGTLIPTGDRARAQTLIDDLAHVGTRHLRLRIPEAAWATPEGRRWLEWLLPAVSEQTTLLPVVTAAEVARPADGGFIALLAAHSDRVEVIAGSPSDTLQGLSVLQEHAVEPVTGVSVGDAELRLTELGWAGALADTHAVMLHGFPAPGDRWQGWSTQVEETRAALEQTGHSLPIWIATGCSTSGHRDRFQIEAFADAATAPAARVYWHDIRDAPEVRNHNPLPIHEGLADQQGRPKLLLRLLESGGLPRVRTTIHATRNPAPLHSDEPVTLITGGAGFIGSNVADRVLSAGGRVILLDNLARPGTEQNLHWLLERHFDRLDFRLGDVRDAELVRDAVAQAGQIFHFAAQVAVTTSLDEPIDDFQTNGLGTLNLLEAIRQRKDPPSLLFTSTNKVYGGLDDIALRNSGQRYEPENAAIRDSGVDESRPLEFCSPYGCSKGCADQYVLDYARTFGIPAAVFRMSCIYGPRQFGTEDQGWIAHFLIQALRGHPITIYGDGLQVRDVLYVDDLVDAMLLAHEQMPRIAGEAFNIGGGPDNVLSLKQLLGMIEQHRGRFPQVRYEGWRASDQRYYVSNVQKFAAATGWQPRTPVSEGVAQLYDWLAAQHGLAAPRDRRMAL